MSVVVYGIRLDNNVCIEDETYEVVTELKDWNKGLAYEVIEVPMEHLDNVLSKYEEECGEECRDRVNEVMVLDIED